MNEKYRLEIENFIQRFGKYRDARIVLYGIGRYTATLLEGISGFRIVGLMDKDPSSVGKVMFGVPVIDKAVAEKTADMVIINTAETYWNVIYNRIRDMNIPIYYLNGEKAECKAAIYRENPYRGLGYSELKQEAEAADIISFDFFDTLFMRCICNPQDVFRLMEDVLQIPFTQMRNQALKQVRENYSLDELYEQIGAAEGLDRRQTDAMKKAETDLERKLIVPRLPVLACLKYFLEQGKEIYIISDMYLPKSFFLDVLRENGMDIAEDFILVSNESGANKADGSMWKLYSERYTKGRKALHVGDDCMADVARPKEYGINTYHVPKAWDMLLHSSLTDVASQVCEMYGAAVMGCVVNRLFENPYLFYHKDGTVEIRQNYDMGYCVLGPVILTFLLWLRRHSREDGIRKLVFMARDGYFLKEDYEFLCKEMGEERECCYLGISRQLAMAASIETEQDLIEYALMPYTGSAAEMIEDRFGIKNVPQIEGKKAEEYIIEYLPEIKKNLGHVRKNYLDYIRQMNLDDRCAVVDIGYYGNNQRYLNKLLMTKMSGYYFNANLSEGNKNAKIQRMQVCFQMEDDYSGEKSHILKKQIYLESFLTAPYGMVKGIEKDGSFICAPPKENQRYFQDKEEINQGVQQFIADYTARFGKFDMVPNTQFIDRYYGDCFSGALEFTDKVKDSFYNDNAMMNRIESKVFY